MLRVGIYAALFLALVAIDGHYAEAALVLGYIIYPLAQWIASKRQTFP